MSVKTVLDVEGMSCPHCVAAVTDALSALPGVEKVKVSLEKGEAKVKHGVEVSVETLKNAVAEAGFSAR
ncbi:MAG: heavy-metal-associated domain-containing protein [Coriobacteriales bacterium]|jgi:copper ion binding protein|nr:heavy-metal-associated domain-containing protein [Coriobacteriales bacterium]